MTTPQLNDTNEVKPVEEVISQKDLPSQETISLHIQKQKGKTGALEIAGGAVLGSLSILIGFLWDMYVEPFMGGPKFAYGMTWFDMLAIPILVAFFIFGIRSGLIAAIIGCGAIVAYLSESHGWLAMIPKFVATTTMFVVPWLILKINENRKQKGKIVHLKKIHYSSSTFLPIFNYLFLMSIAIVSRMVIMFILNVLLVIPLFSYLTFGGTFTTVFTNPTFILTLGAGYFAWNGVQGIADATLSYLIVYPTKLYKTFSIW